MVMIWSGTIYSILYILCLIIEWARETNKRIACTLNITRTVWLPYCCCTIVPVAYHSHCVAFTFTHQSRDLFRMPLGHSPIPALQVRLTNSPRCGVVWHVKLPHTWRTLTPVIILSSSSYRTHRLIIAPSRGGARTIYVYRVKYIVLRVFTQTPTDVLSLTAGKIFACSWTAMLSAQRLAVCWGKKGGELFCGAVVRMWMLYIVSHTYRLSL